MKKVFVTMVATSAFALATLPGYAQQGTPSTPKSTPSTQRETRQAWSHQEGVVEAKKLMGARIKNAQGKDIGEVEQFLVDPKDGKITHAVIGMGGVAGIGETKVVVPWSEVKVSMDRDKAMVSVDQATLDRAPRYEARERGDRMAPAASPATGNRGTGTYQDNKSMDKK